jgi:hypothetical protein
MIDRFNNQNCNYCDYCDYNNFDDDDCFGTSNKAREILKSLRTYLSQSDFINNINCPINNTNLSLAVRLALLTDLFVFLKKQILTANELSNINNVITYHSQIGGSITVVNSLVSKITSYIAGPCYAPSNTYIFDNYFNIQNGLLNNNLSQNPAIITLSCFSDKIPAFEYIVPSNINAISKLTVTVFPNIYNYLSVSLGIFVVVFLKRASSSSFVITPLHIIIPASQIPLINSAIFINNNNILSVKTCDKIIIVAQTFIDSSIGPVIDNTYLYNGSLPGIVSFYVS